MQIDETDLWRTHGLAVVYIQSSRNEVEHTPYSDLKWCYVELIVCTTENAVS